MERVLFKTMIKGVSKVTKIVLTDDCTSAGHSIFVLCSGPLPRRPTPDELITVRTTRWSDSSDFSELSEYEDDPDLEGYQEVGIFYLFLNELPKVLCINWKKSKPNSPVFLNTQEEARSRTKLNRLMKSLELNGSTLNAETLVAYARMEFLELFVFGCEDSITNEAFYIHPLMVVVDDERGRKTLSINQPLPRGVVELNDSIRTPKKRHLQLILDALQKFHPMEYKIFMYYAGSFPRFPLYSMAKLDFERKYYLIMTTCLTFVYRPSGRLARKTKEKFEALPL